MNKYILALTLTASSLTSGISNAALIDDFNGAYNANAPVWSGAVNNFAYAPAFGGSRTISLASTGSTYQANVIVDDEKYTHNSNSGISATSIISWDSASAVDLTDGGDSIAFALDIIGIDVGSVLFTLNVTDHFNAFSSFSFNLLAGTTGVQYIDFTSFSGIDFDDVRAVSLEIAGGLDTDVALGSIATVPAPPALALLSVGLAMLGFSNRKVNA